jgi:hypothetical protein
MTTTAPASVRKAKPRFLGLLNEISEAEKRGYQWLTAWADRCGDPAVEEVVRLVAAREGEHSASFGRRVTELGFRIRPRPDTEQETRNLGAAGSGLDDLATFEALGYGEATDPAAPDLFDGYFADHSIDPVTGALLGRFIAEERDSGRMLRAAYEDLRARTERAAGVTGAVPG